jgi:leucyl/phenylalanyl-tRNA--protein transferase
MPFYRLGRELVFPPPEEAEPSGLLAIGGDLEPDRLLLAYAHGIFPWYSEGDPILWFSPDPRMILLPASLRISRSLAKALRRTSLEIRLDTHFEGVIRGCASVKRPQGEGTWITDDMIRAYGRLHELGYAHSMEAWEGDQLVGGVYGVSLGGSFFAESMFTLRANASKIALVALARQLRAWRFDLIDCQLYTAHLARFGAAEWERRRFLDLLERSLKRKTRRGKWALEGDPIRPGADSAR